MAYSNTSRATQEAKDSKQEAQGAVRAVARRGRGMAWLSHTAAFVVLVVFSLGSLVGLTGDALTRLLTETQHGWRDAPLAIEIIVSTLLVPAMDIGMLYAATMIRLLRQRRQSGAGLHVGVIVCVGAIEASTYVYMSATYDAPHTFAVWALIVARGLAAPLLATYLSLAMTPPVGSGDILYLTESLAAEGVLSDMAQIAHERSAPTDRKLAIYQAVALMSPADRARIEQVIAAERATRSASSPVSIGDSEPSRDMSLGDSGLPPVLPAPELPPEPPDEPPTDQPPDGPQGGGRHDAVSEPLGHYWPDIRTWEPSSLPGGKLNGHSGGRQSGRQHGNGYHPASRATARSVERSADGKKRARLSGKLTGKRGRTMLANAARRHERVEQVRAWLAAGEAVSKRRIRAAYGVDNDAATGILAEARRAALHAV